MRYLIDPTWRRSDSGRLVLAGSPPRLFRLTVGGSRVADEIESGDDVTPSTLTDRLLDAGAIHPAMPHAVRFGVDDVTIVTPQFGGETVDANRVVVDDGSTPPLAGASRRLDVNRGPAAARNLGRSAVAGPLVAFVDADVDLGSDWLTPLLPHFDDERVGLVAPRVLGERGTSLDLGPTPARVRAGTRVSYVPTAAIVVRVDAFDAVGGFDEQMRFGEDVDFVWRLDDAGWRCRYEPTSTVSHRPRATWVARFHQQVGYGSSAAPLALRHPRALTPFRTNAPTAVALVLLGLGRPASAITIAVGSSAILARRLHELPATESFAIAIRTQVRALEQGVQSVRRVWWPIVALAGLFSSRARRVGLTALLASPRTAAHDVAYGWGVWKAMHRHRTLRPIIPAITAWPSTRRPHQTADERDTRPASDVP